MTLTRSATVTCDECFDVLVNELGPVESSTQVLPSEGSI